ncbi:MAG: sensor histidine kinase [Spirulina sp. SIO3F2]|nr:sensor histidine kinase [Spirulina sp. SIO3F2]
MGVMTQAELEAQVRQLEKANRLLQRQLKRCERACDELEDTNQKKEALLRKVIQDLQQSQASLEQTQTQLVQTEKMSSLGQLVAGVAHEINNPMAFIWGNLQHAEDYAQELTQTLRQYQAALPETPSSLTDYLEDIDLEFLLTDFVNVLQSMRSGADRIRIIVQSLRNFSRLDESPQKAVDIHEGIDNTLMILQHRLKANDQRPAIEVIKTYGQLPFITCYPGQLNQVFMNLLVNAIDACEVTNKNRSFAEITANPNQIQIQTQHLGEAGVQIAIADNGPGIPPAARSRLFDPFFTTKPIGQGTGLGLAISYQIITEHHQGRLDFHSELGQGTTFAIELPPMELTES